MTALRVPVDPNLAAWRSEAEAEGFADRVFVYACDEPGDDAGRWETCRRAAEAARAVWPDVAVLVTGTAVDAEHHGALEQVDVLAPVVNFLEDRSGPHAGDQRDTYEDFLAEPGHELWTYTSCLSFGCGPPGADDDDPYWRGWPGYAVDAPATQARTPSWLAWRYRLAGELYYDVGLRLDDAWADQFAEGGNGDGTLFYPGDPARIGGTRPVPVESLRLKLIRDGREDYELLRRLEEVGRPAHDLAERLVPHAWASSPSAADLGAAHDELVRRVDDAGR
jgi:hypothetical protein